MFNFKKTLNFLGLKKEKILFCYFDPQTYDYTPLDVGYILAILEKENFAKKYDCELVALSDFSYFNSKRTDAETIKNATIILAKKPRAIFFFADNVLVSLVRGTERAQKIAAEIKKSAPGIFIGLQSYKFDAVQMRQIFATRKIDCIITHDPENIFLSLEKIINRERVAGAPRSFLEAEKDVCTGQKNDNFGESLDYLPSPFCFGTLDNFLRLKKEQTNGEFCCFLQSARGCPFGCYYCPRSVKFQRTRCFSAKRFYDEVGYLVSHFGFFRFFVIDDTFVFSKKRLLEFQWEFERRKLESKEIVNVRLFVMTRIEILDEETIDILNSLNVVEIQIGLQTINPQLQYYMNRRVDMQKFSEVAEKLKEVKIKFSLDIIGGLPGDTIEYFKKTIDFAISLKPDRIQVKQLFLTPETKFYQEKERFGIKIQKIKGEFFEPYVTRATGIDEIYNAAAYAYAQKKKEENPQIKWLISSEMKKLKSNNFNEYF